MAEVVYVLCAVMSVLCALLLLRSYFRVRTKLLFWSAVCFVSLALNNILLVIDLIYLPKEIDLSVWRQSIALIGALLFLHNLEWDSQ